MSEEVATPDIAGEGKTGAEEEGKSRSDQPHDAGEVIEVEGEYVEGEHVEGEHLEGEHAEGEQAEGEHIEGEHVEREHIEGEHLEGEFLGEGEELLGEEQEKDEEKEEPKPAVEEVVEEEEGFVEEPPPDPAAPFDFSDSKEALKEPFELRPDQLAEVEQLWELYQNYTPAYTDLDGYITEKELIYMLKCLLLMTYTPEQLQELIHYCVKPPHTEGHIKFEQFVKMVTIRQRDFPIEDEIRAAFQVFDPERTGSVDRELLKEVLAKRGHKMIQKNLDNLIKEVDIANDGTIGIEDAIGTMCIDLNKEDMMMLRAQVYPPDVVPEPED